MGQALVFNFFMESNLRSRVAEFEAGYFLPFVFCLFLFFCKPELSSFSVGCLQSGGWCLANFVEHGWSVRFVISFPGVVCGENKLLWRYELVSALVMCFGRSNGCYCLSGKLCIYTFLFLFFLTGLIC